MDPFEKNLEIFGRFSPAFVEKVRNASLAPSLPDLTEKKRTEADQWLRGLDLGEEHDVLFLYGIGDGSSYTAAESWIKKKADRYLVYLEDDLQALNRFFRAPQARQVMEDPQVIIVAFTAPEEAEGRFIPAEFNFLALLFAHSASHFAVSKEYAQSRQDRLRLLKANLQLGFQDIIWALKFFKLEYMRVYFENFLFNIVRYPGARSLHNLAGKFQGLPALICGAGPSIQADLPTISTMANKAMIFGAGTGMNTLNMANIAAHVGVATDPHIASFSRMLTNRFPS